MKLASVHQANLMPSINVFTHLHGQAQIRGLLQDGKLLWHVIDHDDCRDKRFRQARFPALNGSPYPKTISLPMPSGRTMGSVSLTSEMRDHLIAELRGYAGANKARLCDLSAWFGSTATNAALARSVSLLCDLITSSPACKVAELNVEFMAFFANSWLKRELETISSTEMYANVQSDTRKMLSKVIELHGAGGSPEIGSNLARWDYWFVNPDGTRLKATNNINEWKSARVGGEDFLFPVNPEVLRESKNTEILVPGVLADTVADAVLRDLESATQYWRSDSIVQLASAIAQANWNKSTIAYFVGQPASFQIPSSSPPRWLAGKELEGFRNGIYSTALYFMLGLETQAPPLVGSIRPTPD